jgi:hypothetical protein
MVVLKSRDTMGGFSATIACMVSVLHFRFLRERERERERSINSSALSATLKSEVKPMLLAYY